jgi:hypothetical protein
MSSELVAVASFPYVMHAEQAKLHLEENGIASFLDGANAGAMLSHVGSAVGIRLLVASSDAVQARTLLDAIQNSPPPGSSAWYCGRCHQEVDAGFDDCWSCGRSRNEVETPPPAELQPVMADLSTGDAPDTAAQNSAEKLIQRAWRAALLGVAFFPFQFYAMYLLAKAGSLNVPLSSDARRRYLRTVLLCIFISGCWVTFFSI